jgi:hypothetical protein
MSEQLYWRVAVLFEMRLPFPQKNGYSPNALGYAGWFTYF